MKFSIIVVCLNPGPKLNQTLDSILSQTYPSFEIIVKDGGSRDGSIETMREDRRIHLYQESDHSIYEAMNQAVSHVTGDYILFLNCGDLFYDDEVLTHITVHGTAPGETSGHLLRRYLQREDRDEDIFPTTHHRFRLLPQHSLPSVLLLCCRPVQTEAL